jgi:protein-S-isoprenylcysteine O-methyltransferase Ste14
MNKKNNYIALIAGIFSLIFAYGFTFFILSIPKQLDQIIRYSSIVPGEGFSQSQIIIILILVSLIPAFLTIYGLWKNSSKHSLLGATLYFLPVFEHFTWSMISVMGIGLMLLIWRPFTYVPKADIINIPIELVAGTTLPVEYIGASPGKDRIFMFSDILMIVGFSILFFSIFNYLYARLTNKDLVDYWIYRYIRHPQYLGYIIYSYGVYARTTVVYGINTLGLVSYPSSFPWVLSFLLIICIALNEEMNFVRKFESYSDYREKTSFMIPLPRFLSKMIQLPYNLIVKNHAPESRKQITILFFVYLILFILVSNLPV